MVNEMILSGLHQETSKLELVNPWTSLSTKSFFSEPANVKASHLTTLTKLPQILELERQGWAPLNGFKSVSNQANLWRQGHMGVHRMCLRTMPGKWGQIKM